MPGCGCVSTASATGLPGRLRSHRHEVHADDAVSARRAFFGRAGETREPRRDAGLDKPGGLECADELCFQQSACDSTGPQVDVTQRVVWERLADHDVGDLDAAPGLEDAGDLGDCAVLVRYEIEHAIGDHHIDAL